ncbi:MAG: chorismate synthase [Bacilli bacterium]|nr:chorismate synthase [Bacilli bacterium]
MKNTLGYNVRFTLFGESHNDTIGGVIDGLSAGIKIDEEFIKSQLDKRRPQQGIETSRVEADNFKIISGVFNGYTTGEALCVLIENNNTRSQDYESFKNTPRPSHADFVAFEKYHGYNDYRGGGHFSGRLTSVIVCIGAILIKALEHKNIYIGSHIKKCGKVIDKDFSIDCLEEVKSLQNKSFKLLNDLEEKITSEIKEAASHQDSIGGVIQTAIVGLPIGLGDPWFSSVEGMLSNALFSIGGVKGVEFGAGFNFAEMVGSCANDGLILEDNKVKTKTNNNGGINGGITNGMPVVFNVCVKPTPSIAKTQDTINLETHENVKLNITGRHDPAIIRRIAVVIDSITAIVVCDLLKTKYGDDFLR